MDAALTSQTVAALGRLGQFIYLKAFVRLRDDLIDHGFHVLRAFPDGQLPVRSGSSH
jgi:hypothetical protein